LGCEVGIVCHQRCRFFAVFGFVIDTSWLTVPLLLLAVAFHELGHLAGMWIFGYRDLQILFIPAFGAMTTGIKTQAPPWQRAVVAFLGSMPGLILSCALLLTLQPPEDSWQFQLFAIMLASITSIYSHYCRLMGRHRGSCNRSSPPVHHDSHDAHQRAGIRSCRHLSSRRDPFDPGRRITYRSSFTMARGKSPEALSQEIPEGDGDEVLHRIFAELSKPQYSRLSFGTRVAFARKFLSHRKNGSAGSLLAGISLAVQIITLAIPLLVWIALVRQ
jgi:hypothetical protein